eukprot:488288_1
MDIFIIHHTLFSFGVIVLHILFDRITQKCMLTIADIFLQQFTIGCEQVLTDIVTIVSTKHKPHDMDIDTAVDTNPSQIEENINNENITTTQQPSFGNVNMITIYETLKNIESEIDILNNRANMKSDLLL